MPRPHTTPTAGPTTGLAAGLALVGLLGLAACPKPTAGNDPSNGPATPGAADPGADPGVNSGANSGANLDANPGITPTAGCLSDADCAGGVCEGQGCTDTKPGTCMPADRMCTRDAALYCGCDGKPFHASGSCPGRRYASKGECAPSGPAKPDGASCLAASECSSGICEGQGCNDTEPGTCAPVQRMCTRDAQVYCGCDGAIFRASGSCPGQRFASRGECAAAPAPSGA